MTSLALACVPSLPLPTRSKSREAHRPRGEGQPGRGFRFNAVLDRAVAKTPATFETRWRAGGRRAQAGLTFVGLSKRTGSRGHASQASKSASAVGGILSGRRCSDTGRHHRVSHCQQPRQRRIVQKRYRKGVRALHARGLTPLRYRFSSNGGETRDSRAFEVG
jgi:hypothetical protein